MMLLVWNEVTNVESLAQCLAHDIDSQKPLLLLPCYFCYWFQKHHYPRWKMCTSVLDCLDCGSYHLLAMCPHEWVSISSSVDADNSNYFIDTWGQNVLLLKHLEQNLPHIKCSKNTGLSDSQRVPWLQKRLGIHALACELLEGGIL